MRYKKLSADTCFEARDLSTIIAFDNGHRRARWRSGRGAAAARRVVRAQ
jgi:hypothetical protein